MSQETWTGVVVDTDVVSYLLKGDTRADIYRPFLEAPRRVAIISFMTVAELDRWALQRGWGEDRRRAMDRLLMERFLIDGEVDRELCRIWAQINHGVQTQGRHIACADAWVASLTLARDVPLLTHNRRDFEGVPGLKLLPETLSDRPGEDA